METRWRIELLGRLRATQGEHVVTRFRAQKGGALLAYLAYHLDRPHPREELIELFWPTSEPSRGRNSLSRELSSLRCQLEPPGVPSGAVIVADRACVRLNPAACTTDVLEFEAALKAAAQAGSAAVPRPGSSIKVADLCSSPGSSSDPSAERLRCLIQAADRYGGELLPGYFESWIMPERQRLADAYLQLLEELVAHHEQAGDLHAALQFAWRAVAADTLREESQYHLIRLLVLNGQPAAALQQYQDLERLLASELGLQPAPELQALAGELQCRADSIASSQVSNPLHGTAPRRHAAANFEAAAVPRPNRGRSRFRGGGDRIVFSVHRLYGTEIRLPVEFTRFFGREEELHRLQALLGQPFGSLAATVDGPSVHLTDRPRLLTLTGPGGSGKTRLAVQAARRIAEQDQRPVWFVPLADLSDARLLGDKMAASLNLPRSPGVSPLEQVVAFLSHRAISAQPGEAGTRPVLVLDNFEHLVAEGAGLVRELLERIPSLTCLVTSRQPLALTGEQEFPVAPLPTPALSSAAPSGSDFRSPTPDTLIACPSVQLFVDRAQAVRPAFQLRPGNAAAVAALCARLEGLPLALELAAARVGVLTPAQMLRRLEQRFDFLVSRKRDATPRHRSLRAALDWSYQLLCPELQRFFARLSVFQGGWTLEAAEAVCEAGGATDEGPRSGGPGPGHALAFLEQLRECSLVEVAETGSEIRFRLLETLREFGAEQLAPEEREAVAHRHASYFLALGERAEPEVKRGEQMAWLDRLERDIDNLRAALSWLEASGRIQEALRLGGALHLFWEIRSRPAEGLARLKALLALPEAQARTSARAKALTGAGALASVLGEHETALSFQEESLAIGRELGDRWNTAFALTCMASALNHLGRLEAARPLWEEALPIWREINDPFMIACTLTGLGLATRDLHDSRAILRECLTLRRQLGDQWGVALVLDRMGLLARDTGDHEEARSLWQESLVRAQEVGSRSLTCGSLLGLGQLAYLKGDLPTARALLEQSLSLAREMGNRRGVGQILIQLAEVAGEQGDLDMAVACMEEASAFWCLMGDKAEIAGSLRVQGRIALRRDDPVTAGRCFAESLAMRQAARNTSEISRCLEDMAELAHLRRHEERAARLLGAAAALREEMGSPRPAVERADRLLGAAAALREEVGLPRPPVQCAEFDRRLGEVRSALGEPEFIAAWSAGRTMSSEQAIAEAVLEAPADSAMATGRGHS